jgi:large subunit ribosomal protein L9
MAKTEVILTSNIVGLGAESDQVKVAAGYARNFLFPQGLAIPLTGANKKRIESLRKKRAEREAHELNTMLDLAKGIDKLICLIKAKTGDDGRMFGSVTAGTITDELKHQFDIALDKRKIHLEEPIKAVGDYEVELRLHHGVTAKLKVKVESTTPPPVPAAETKPAESTRDGAHRTEKRGRRTYTNEAKPEAGEPKSEKPKRPAAKSDKPTKAE